MQPMEGVTARLSPSTANSEAMASVPDVSAGRHDVAAGLKRGFSAGWQRTLLVAPGLTLVVLFLLVPLIWLIGDSFTHWTSILGAPRWNGLATWRSLLGDPTFHLALRHTLIWAALSATIPPVLGLAVAMLLFQVGGWPTTIARTGLIIPLLLPPAVVATIWSMLYDPLLGPIDTALNAVGFGHVAFLSSPTLSLGSILITAIWSSIGISVIIIGAALASIEGEYLLLAQAEGASWWQQVRRVLLPAVRRPTALAMILTMVLASQVFDLLWVLTIPANASAVDMLPYDMYQRAFLNSGTVSQAAAEACVQVGIGLLLTLGIFLVGRPDMQGMTGRNGQADNSSTAWGRIAALAIALVVAAPVLWTLTTAFVPTGRATLGELVPSWPLYIESFSDAWNGGIGAGVANSLVIAVLVVLLTCGLGLGVAFFLSMQASSSWMRRAVIGLLLATMLQPGEPFLIPLYRLLDDIGLLGSVTGLILVETARTLPFTILLLAMFLRSVNREVLSAAEMDAGRGFRLLVSVMVPLCLRALAAAALWTFISSWSEFTLPTILMNGSSWVTAPLALRAFAGAGAVPFNLLAAGCLLVIAPVVILLLALGSPAGRSLRTAARGLA
jgi:ABC-type sugar transport system permease subunit